MTSLLKNKNLQKKLSITMLGNVINAAMQWIQISLITKFCSSVQLGLFTLSLSILGPLFVLSGMQLRTVQVTDFNKNWNFSNYFTLRLITNLFVLIILIPYLVNIKTNLLSIFFLLTILKVIESFADVYNGLQQLNDRLHIVSYSLMLRSITTTIAIFIGITVFNNLSLGLLSAAICSLLLLLLFDYRLSKPLIASQKILQFNKKELFALLFKAIPLGVVMFFIYLNSNVSKYFIESYLGTEIQGSYSAISYLIAIGILVDNSIGQTFIYKMAKHYSLNEFSSFSKIVKYYLLFNLILGISIFIVSMLFGKTILTFFFNENIASHYYLFSLIMFSGIFMNLSSVLNYTLTSMKIFKIQPLIHFIVLIVNVIFCYLFIEKYGVYGVTFALLISFIVQFFLSLYFIKKNYAKTN